MKPSFSELRESFCMQKILAEDDGFGGVRETWVEDRTLWGKMEFVSAKDITTRSLKGVGDASIPLRKSLYRLTFRSIPDLPEHIRFVRQHQTLLSLSCPIEEGGYMSVYVVER